VIGKHKIFRKVFFISSSGYCGSTYSSDVKLRVGSTFKDTGGKVVEVDRIVVHPDYNIDDIANDYSILILKEKLVFGPEVQPIKIQCDCKPVVDGTLCNVTG
jgi:ABC-type ATPase with predicted acetyltransferase domain